MEPTKKINGRDELDLVELIGIPLKWRKVVITIVISITLVTLVGCFVVAYYRSRTNLSAKFAPKYIGEVKKDALYSSFNFFNHQQIVNNYQVFLVNLLFVPAKFEISFSDSDAYMTHYLFENQKDMEDFVVKYNKVIDLLDSLLESRNKLSGTLLEGCNRLATLTDKTSSLSTKKCDEYNYYNTVVGNRFTYATGIKTDVSSAYADFLASFMENTKLNKINQVDVGVYRQKNQTTNHINIKKIMKYSLIAMIASVIIGIFSAFILEFWVTNRERIKGYLE